MPFDIGINFRGTEAYVTDGTNETSCTRENFSDGKYPISRGGVTFGWDTVYQTIGGSDRSMDVDHRLAGAHSVTDGTSNRFRLDLPASGAYTVHLALGDALYPSLQTVDLLDSDGVGLLNNIVTGGSTDAGSFYDATGAIYTAADWPGSEQGVAVNVSGTAIYVKLALYSAIAHLRVVSAGGGTAAPLFRRTLYRRAGSRGVH